MHAPAPESPGAALSGWRAGAGAGDPAHAAGRGQSAGQDQNYINLLLADREVRAQDAQAWAVLLDHDGNLAEGLGSNIFFVRDGELLTPRARFVLPGISRDTVIDLAGEEGLTVHESDLDLFDAFTSDECFLTSTSLCMVPVSSLNGRPIGDGGVPGPVTAQLMEAYKRLLDFDFVAQYTNKL